MAIFKCKMCGGALEINNKTVIECEYCGTKQTLPKLEDERKANLYDRANHFRRNNEFDKAMAIYEQILNEDNTDAECYWSLVLCRYGIEYVEDPATKKRIPTVNRAQFTSVFDDEDYKSALKYADILQKAIYEEEATVINDIQKGILAISQKEEPFDVFICYKETDQNGRRTPDSVLATELYHELAREGFKVFFSRITLEDKLGSAYEPYIFAALNSAKVMVVLGTKPEYFNAVWVKNEWSRYLTLIKNGARKMLIPAYKDMNPYDLPEEFSHLQAQDMSKLGFMQDLIRGIKKIVEAETPKTTVIKETVISSEVPTANVVALLKRGFMALEDGEWEKADDFFEQCLNQNAELAEAYIGKLMAELQVKNKEELKNQAAPFDDRNNYKKAVRFADARLKSEIEGYIGFINNRNLTNAYNDAINAMNNATTEANYKNAAERFKRLANFKDSKQLVGDCLEKAENARLEAIYSYAYRIMKSANNEKLCLEAADTFEKISGYKDSDELAKQCYEKIEFMRKDKIYRSAIFYMEGGTVLSLEKAIEIFKTIEDWNDCAEKISLCQKKIEEINAKEKADILEYKRQAEIARKESEKKAKLIKKIAIIVTSIVCVVIAFIIVLNIIIIPNIKYNKAVALLESGKLEDAYDAFMNLDDYKNSLKKAENIRITKNKDKLKNCNVGNYVKFGVYEQDNDISNGKEEIEWLVLDTKDNKALVISKYALDCKPYNNSIKDITWETSSLRNWLNNEFINSAFSKKEQSVIHAVANSDDTILDLVFLLSIEEANKYFSSNIARMCVGTDYVLENSVGKSDNGYCFWWLRSPYRPIQYDGMMYASFVYADGYISNGGIDVNRADTAVRPAMWIDLSKLD